MATEGKVATKGKVATRSKVATRCASATLAEETEEQGPKSKKAKLSDHQTEAGAGGSADG